MHSRGMDLSVIMIYHDLSPVAQTRTPMISNNLQWSPMISRHGKIREMDNDNSWLETTRIPPSCFWQRRNRMAPDGANREKPGK